MGLDVYFRRDIANVLRATACASEGSMGLALELLGESAPLLECDREKLLQAYQQGVRNTLLAVGLAFGLEVHPVDGSPSIQRQQGVMPGLAGLLWSEIPQER